MKSLFISIFLIITSFASAQISTFKAEAINIKLYSDSLQQFEEWSGWYPSDVIIALSEEKVNIYSNYEQKYIIISEINKIINTKNRKIMEFDALDINGSRCTIELVHWDTGQVQMYIRWTNLQLAYKIRKL